MIELKHNYQLFPRKLHLVCTSMCRVENTWEKNLFNRLISTAPPAVTLIVRVCLNEFVELIDHFAFYQSPQVEAALLGLAASSFVPTKYMQ